MGTNNLLTIMMYALASIRFKENSTGFYLNAPNASLVRLFLQPFANSQNRIL
jgi:hypothetical protein